MTRRLSQPCPLEGPDPSLESMVSRAADSRRNPVQVDRAVRLDYLDANEILTIE
jgi:hypothetical protein